MQNKVEGYRLSPQQRRLWSAQPPDSPLLAHLALRLLGPLSSDSLSLSLLSLAHRHLALRTLFLRSPGIRLPIQLVSDLPSLAFDTLALPHTDPAAAVELLIQQLEDEKIDLERGPVVRARLAVLGPADHLLVLQMPSLCADAKSLMNFAEEFASGYELAVSGKQIGEMIGDEPVDYIQFSEWQNELIEEGGNEADLLRTRASLALETAPLPFEERPGEEAAFEPADIEFGIEPGLVSSIDATARECGASVSDFLFACWHALIWRLTGENETAIFYTVDGRKYEGMGEALGLYAKSLPTVMRFQSGLLFRQALAELARRAREIRDMQEYFAWSEDDPIDNARLAIGYEFVECPELKTKGGVTFSILKQSASFEPFKIKLAFARKGDSIEGEFLYNRRAFSDTVAAKLAGHYRTLVEAAANNPESPVAALEILTPDEHRRLVVELNDTARVYPAGSCFHQLFEEQVGRTPDHTAVIIRDQKMTYRELNARANRLAHHLRRLGVCPGSLVGICVERSANMLIGLIGILKAGGAYVPLDSSYPKERLSYMLEDAQVQVLLTSDRLAPEFAKLAIKLVRLDADDEVISLESGLNVENTAVPEDLAYVIYTSGSTGRPKGVMITHSGLVNYLSWAVEAYNVAGGQGSPVHSPVGFDLTITSLFTSLLAGKSVELISEEEGIDGLSLALRRSSGYSLVKLTPSHLEVLSHQLQSEQIAGRANALIIGGEALMAEMLAPWREFAPGTRLINEYGPTETVVGCSVYEVTDSTPSRGPVPIGRPVANTQLYILNDRYQVAPAGVAGELYIGGAGVARGYLNQPLLTAERFLPDPFSSAPGSRLYRTGDLARLLPDGNIEFLGRLDHQVKIRGFRIELAEIEAALVSHPDVREAVVIASRAAQGDTRLVAYVVAGEGVSVTELREHVVSKVPDYMVPAAFVKMDRLPLTANGKLDRNALPEPGHARPNLEVDYVRPQTVTEEVLAAIWSQTLGVDEVGIHDNFFTLGGDSLRSVQVVGMAKEKGIGFTVHELFQHQTIHDLTRHVSLTGDSPLETFRTEPFSLISQEDRNKLPDYVEDAYPLTMLQTGMIYHMEMDPDSPTYHNVSSWHLRVDFDEELFCEAVQQVVACHPVLRTSFDLVGYSVPLQLVHEAAYLEVPVEDLRHMPLDEQERALAAYLEKVRRQVFNFSRPPLLRYDIHRRTDETIQLTLVECHPIIDGWSTTFTLAEIFARYFALVDGQPLEENPIRSTFRDFVRMEQMTLESDETRRFWAQKLDGCVPTRIPRWPSSTLNRNGDRNRVRVITFSPEIYEGLKQLAREAVIPLKSVLLASHLKVLSMMSGQEEVVTGLSVNGRMEEAGGERVRGLFLNVIPFRQRLCEGTWIDLVRQTFETELEILPHRRYPLAAMRQQWGRQVIFETLFNYLHFHAVEGVLKSGRLEILGSKDLSDTNFIQMAGFQVDPLSRQLILRLHCDTFEMGDSQINGLAECYVKTLTAMAKDRQELHTKLKVLDFLTEGERSVLEETTRIDELDATFSF